MVKNPPAYAGDGGLIPGSGRFPWEGNGNPLQYNCQGNSMDRGVCRVAVHGVARVGPNLMTKQQHNRCTKDCGSVMSNATDWLIP